MVGQKVVAWELNRVTPLLPLLPLSHERPQSPSNKATTLFSFGRVQSRVVLAVRADRGVLVVWDVGVITYVVLCCGWGSDQVAIETSGSFPIRPAAFGVGALAPCLLSAGTPAKSRLRCLPSHSSSIPSSLEPPTLWSPPSRRPPSATPKPGCRSPLAGADVRLGVARKSTIAHHP